MQEMNNSLYSNMQQANQSHIAYVERSQQHLIDLASNIGTAIHDLAIPSVADSAKKHLNNWSVHTVTCNRILGILILSFKI